MTTATAALHPPATPSRRPGARAVAALLAVVGAGMMMGTLTAADDTTVRLVQQDGGWQLLRGGAPFVIKGAAGDAPMADLVKAGGNTGRTWDSSGAIAELMDQAQANHLAIITGVWLGQVRQDFNWSDAASVTAELEKTKDEVRKWKDHPATLIWDLGNEMESMDIAHDDIAVWQGIERIAKAVKEVDPNHPTMTTVAEIGGDKVANIHKYCPDIDIVGINSYGGGPSVPERYRKAGGTKPYILTEYGPPGVWETKKDAFGACDEQTSTAKGDNYQRTYEAAAKDHQLCLGSVAFTWGHKNEATLTWFGMVLKDGSRLEAVDRLTTLWGGTVANHCPTIAPIAITEGATTVFKPGDTIHATVAAKDPEGDALTAQWQLADEALNFDVGGDLQAEPPTYEGAIVASDAGSATVKLPAGGGLYRLYVTVRDGHGGAATANAVLKIDGPIIPPKALKPGLPVAFIGEPQRPLWATTGFMGDPATRGGIRMDPGCSDQPHSGKYCIKVAIPGNAGGWGGVFWQNPANDWGKLPGGFDLTGAKRLAFWARGADGGEKITFGYGGLKDGTFVDSCAGEMVVTLTKDWKEYTFDVSGADLSRIKTGFRWSVAGLTGQPVTFFLDDARWE